MYFVFDRPLSNTLMCLHINNNNNKGINMYSTLHDNTKKTKKAQVKTILSDVLPTSLPRVSTCGGNSDGSVFIHFTVNDKTLNTHLSNYEAMTLLNQLTKELLGQ